MDKEGRQKFYINVCRVLNPISLNPGCDSDAAVCMTEFDAAQVLFYVKGIHIELNFSFMH